MPALPGLRGIAWLLEIKARSDDRVREIGSNTNRLIDNRRNAEKYSGIPRQSCIPVAIRKLP